MLTNATIDSRIVKGAIGDSESHFINSKVFDLGKDVAFSVDHFEAMGSGAMLVESRTC